MPSFKARGIDAPRTTSTPRKNDAELDLAQLSEAVGEAQEVSPEALAKLEARGQTKRTEGIDFEGGGAAPREQAPQADRPPPAAEPVMPSAPAQPDGYENAEPRKKAKIAGDEAAASQMERALELRQRQAAEREESSKQQEERASAERQARHDLDQRLNIDGASSDVTVEKPAEPVEPAPPKTGKSDKDAKGEKSGEKAGGESNEKKDPAKTLLPPITRAPALGKILVTGESGHLEALQPRAVRVIAYVEGSRARTVVDYVFENPHKQRLEGTFYYPLPADGSPAGFAMFEGTKRVEGESMFQSRGLLPELGKQMIDPLALDDTAPRRAKKIDWGTRKDARVVEQKRAREVYEELVRSQIDPALMEWSGGSNFTARVFPLEPESLKRIVVAYEQPLVFDGKSFRYSYALPAEASIKEREAVLFVDGAHGTIAETPRGTDEKKLGRWSRFELAKPEPGALLSVAVQPPSPNVVLRGRDRAGLPGDSFYAEVRPQIAKGDEVPTGRALILVDTSLSSEEDGAYGRRAKLIEALLERDRTIKQYAVALFDLRTRWLGGTIGWRENSDTNRRETAEELRRVYLEGATSFASVLDELTRQRKWAVDGEKTTVFLFSDGEITWGMDRIEGLAARYPVLRDVRWITYRFGDLPVNRILFDYLSTETRGRTISLLSEAEVDDAAVAHRAEPAVLEKVEVKGAKSVDLVVAGEPKLVFPGQTLMIAGRLPDGGAATLSLSIRTGSKLSALEVPLGDKDGEDMFAPRAWADLHTKRLIAMDDVRLDRMIVALSQHYRLANARASFLVLDREEQVKDYKLEDEKLELSNLEELRRREEDQRRDRLLGIALDEVPREGRDVIDVLKRRTDGLAPFLKTQPLLEYPFAGGDERLAAEAEYRKAREAEKLDYLMYDRIARARALAGDTAGAVRALSSVVEIRPRDSEAMRLVGYALMALAQYDVAEELFERLRLLRPFEPEAYLEEALALDAIGRYDEAARNYEIVLARSWARHQTETRTTAAYHYARLLGAIAESGVLRGEEAALVARRLEALRSGGADGIGKPIDLQLTTFWSTDSIDIDLWVYEPNGEKCFYSHRETTLGGHLFWDVTDGLGPELYQAVKAHPGQYDTLVHFYGSRAPRLKAPTAMLMVVDRDLFRSKSAQGRRFQMRMLPQKDAVLMMRTDVFEAR